MAGTCPRTGGLLRDAATARRGLNAAPTRPARVTTPHPRPTALHQPAAAATKKVPPSAGGGPQELRCIAALPHSLLGCGGQPAPRGGKASGRARGGQGAGTGQRSQPPPPAPAPPPPLPTFFPPHETFRFPLPLLPLFSRPCPPLPPSGGLSSPHPPPSAHQSGAVCPHLRDGGRGAAATSPVADGSLRSQRSAL